MAKDLEFTAKVAADLPAATRKDEALKKLVDAWNSKNAKAAKRAGTFGFMAAALAACGGSGGPDNKDGGNETTFRFLTGTAANLSTQSLNLQSLDAATAGSKDKALNVEGLLGASVPIDASQGLIVPVGQTFVGDISLFNSNGGEGIAVSGEGNLWIIAPEDGFDENDEQTVILDINLEGGRLTFDMPSDDFRIIIDNRSKIDIGGGTLQISDGDVFVSAENYASWNVGAPLIVNSSLTEHSTSLARLFHEHVPIDSTALAHPGEMICEACYS